MKAYVQGVWGYGSLYFIDGDQLYYEYSGAEGRVDSYNDSLADVVKEQGIEGVSKIVVKDHLAQIEKSWFSIGETLQFDHRKGTITYVQDGVEEIIYVGENVIFDDSEIEKLSDTPSYTCDELIGTFEDAHKNYEPPLSLCKLTNEEYAKALMELHPETKNFPVAYEDDNEHIFSDTGHSASSGGQYDSVLMWTDNTVVFSKRANSTDTYKVILSESSLLIQDKHHRESWETMIADALALFGGAPGLPTPQELIAEFREKGENYVLNPSLFEYSTEIDGIKFEMDEAFAANNNSKLLILRFE